jgi:glycosyltransferase involved in cell wall biosynthesis
MRHINVIIPIYNEKEIVINDLIKNLKISLLKITNNWKIILVDDGSSNECWEIILKTCSTDSNISGIKLSKNFGQHCAIKAGIDNAKSDFTIVIDGDMQDDPKYIDELYLNIKQGYDVVYCERSERKDFLQFTYSKIFYFLFNLLSKQKLNQKVANFCIFNQKILNKLKKDKLTHMSFFASIKGLSSKEKFIKTTRNQRLPGSKPTYSLSNRFKLAKNTIISFSDRLIYFSIISGLIFFVFSIFTTIYLILNKIYLDPSAPVSGWTSLSTLMLFSFGLTNFSIGIIGLYINSIHDIVKEQNPYFVDKKINLD